MMHLRYFKRTMHFNTGRILLHNNIATTTLLHSRNNLFSRTTWETGTRKVKHSGFYWSERWRVTVASAGPYANHLHLAPDR